MTIKKAYTYEDYIAACDAVRYPNKDRISQEDFEESTAASRAIYVEKKAGYCGERGYEPVKAPPASKAKGVNPKDLIGATKAPVSLLPSAALVQTTQVFALGAKKYGPHNWREPGKAVQHMTYCEAALRHLYSYIDGESIDPESGASHLAHAAAGLLILLDAIACGNAVDNRPTPAPTAELIALQTKKA